MNIDEDEVTREPFEEETSYDEDQICVSTEQEDHDAQAYLVVKDEVGTNANYDVTVDETENDTDDDSINKEDIEYAESFGIQLKDSKNRAGYERLILSDLFESTTNKSQNKDSTESRPLIETSVTSDCIYHKGCFYQKGDIVALCDQDDGFVYFAQLVGFLQDQYCEKSASVNWLVPTRPTSRRYFDPSAYKIGLEDVQLRKLDCMTFVRHCPHDYYIRKFFHSSKILNQPIDDPQQTTSKGDARLEPNYKKSNKNQTFIWTTMRPCVVPTIETDKQV